MGYAERIRPDETPPGIIAIHLQRYAFARPLCEGKRVLDAACGAGYGTAYLADVAAHVIGIDVSEEALAYARRRYGSGGATFEKMDVAALAFPDRSFDVVCSFETIEHVDDRETTVSEAARVLAEDGAYVVSTPKVEQTTWSPANQFHRVEFSAEDFASLLRTCFNEVELCGQRRLQASRHRAMQRLDVLGLRRRLDILRPAARLLGTAPMAELTLEDLVIDSDLDNADDLVAICRRPVHAWDR